MHEETCSTESVVPAPSYWPVARNILSAKLRRTLQNPGSSFAFCIQKEGMLSYSLPTFDFQEEKKIALAAFIHVRTFGRDYVNCASTACYTKDGESCKTLNI